MAKKRVHEIAKEKGISSKKVLEVLQRAGLDVKAAASSVDEADIARAFGNGAPRGGGDDRGPEASGGAAGGSPAGRPGDGAQRRSGAGPRAGGDRPGRGGAGTYLLRSRYL